MNLNKPLVIVYNKLPEELKEKLEKVCQSVYVDKGVLEKDPLSVKELVKAEALLGSGLKVGKGLLDLMPALKIVTNISVGYDNLDTEELSKRGIMATNTPDVLTDTTADTIFGLLLATARRIPELDRIVKEGKWDKSIGPELFGMDVHHKTLGIIGMGRIGEAIAQRAYAGFNMNILYHNRNRAFEAEKKYAARSRTLEELLQESDFICVMVPLSTETKNLVGEHELNLIKDTSVLIVGSRGGIVNEQALAVALENGKLRAAGLDVYEKEPLDPNHPLLKLENVLSLPHIGSATIETRSKMGALAVKNLIDGLTDRKPVSLINANVWDQE